MVSLLEAHYGVFKFFNQRGLFETQQKGFQNLELIR